MLAEIAKARGDRAAAAERYKKSLAVDPNGVYSIRGMRIVPSASFLLPSSGLVRLEVDAGHTGARAGGVVLVEQEVALLFLVRAVALVTVLHKNGTDLGFEDVRLCGMNSRWSQRHEEHQTSNTQQRISGGKDA